MNDNLKIVKSLEDTENVTKEQIGGFLGIVQGILCASLLCNILTGQEVKRAGNGVIHVGKIF